MLVAVGPASFNNLIKFKTPSGYPPLTLSSGLRSYILVWVELREIGGVFRKGYGKSHAAIMESR
jgi:hypothetical protein